MGYEELLNASVCPETKQSFCLAPISIIDELNREIQKGLTKNRNGKIIYKEISGGFIREDGLYLYPIVDGIPVLIIEEAIPLRKSE